MLPRIPSRKPEIKKKDDENAKKLTELLHEEIDIKVALAKTITRRRRIVHRLNILTEQTRIQRSILADVCNDLEALGHDTARLSQVIAVLEKIDIVVTQETAKV